MAEYSRFHKRSKGKSWGQLYKDDRNHDLSYYTICCCVYSFRSNGSHFTSHTRGHKDNYYVFLYRAYLLTILEVHICQPHSMSVMKCHHSVSTLHITESIQDPENFNSGFHSSVFLESIGWLMLINNSTG